MILHIYNKFVKAATKFDAATPEGIATRASLQRAINLIDHATGTVAERKEEKTEEYASKNRSQLSRNLVEQTTGEVNTIFSGSNGWVNDSAPSSAPYTLRITGGTGAAMAQQATPFLEEGHAPTSGTAQKLHRDLTGGTPTLQNTRVEGNGVGVTNGPETAPPATTSEGQQQFSVRGV